MGLLTIIFLTLEQLLLLFHGGDVEKSLEQYQEYVKTEKKENFELLQKIAIEALKQGAGSKDEDILNCGNYCEECRDKDINELYEDILNED